MIRRRAHWKRAALGALAGTGVLAVAAAAWNASDARTSAEREALAVKGAALYSEHCAVCHGSGLGGAVLGAGLAGPPLVKPGFRFFFALLPVGMEGFVRKEIAEGENLMPPFAGRLPEQDIAALAFYVRRRNREQR